MDTELIMKMTLLRFITSVGARERITPGVVDALAPNREPTTLLMEKKSLRKILIDFSRTMLVKQKTLPSGDGKLKKPTQGEKSYMTQFVITAWVKVSSPLTAQNPVEVRQTSGTNPLVSRYGGTSGSGVIWNTTVKLPRPNGRLSSRIA